MTNKFIQKIVENENKRGHKYMTHKLLKIPNSFNLATVKPLLENIMKTPLNENVSNPYNIGLPSYKVTKELKQHVNSALNLINISQGKYRKK